MAKHYGKTLDTDDKAAYLMALDDLPLEAVQYAMRQIFRAERYMPVATTLREHAKHYRETQIHRAAHAAAKELPQRTETTDDIGRQAIQHLLGMLGDDMELKHPVYQEPSLDDPDERRAALLAQARQLMHEQTNGKD